MPSTSKDPLAKWDDTTDDLVKMRDMSFEDLVNLGEEAGALVDTAQLGDGFMLLEAPQLKKHLIGVPFVILGKPRINDSNRFAGTVFATLRIKTQHPIAALGNNQHFIVNDGSTGICRQVEGMAFKKNGVVLCRKGLRMSEYKVQTPVLNEDNEQELDARGRPVTRDLLDDNGNPIWGTTFYLDTSL